MKLRSIWEKPVAPLPQEAGEMIRYAGGVSCLGMVLVATGENGIVMISIAESMDELVAELEARFPRAEVIRGHREEKQVLGQILDWITEPVGKLELSLDMRGTAFQKRVWQAVQKIPPGQTSTYTEIARNIGAPKAMRAVGTACAKCDFALAVPCHRILRSDGSFRGGDWSDGRQAMLIAREVEAAQKQTSTDKKSSRQ